VTRFAAAIVLLFLLFVMMVGAYVAFGVIIR
jgi:hypothetical protein